MAKQVKPQSTEQVGPPAVTLQVNPDSAPTHATRFISNEVAKFARSNTRIYLALILDVIHGHAAVQPRGYAAMLTALAPHLSMLPKYCTVINPALRSKHAEELASFPATVDGLSKAVAWYENQSDKAGYSLSLEDMVRYFKGEWSVKAQAQAKADAMRLAQTTDVQAAADAATKREEEGAAQATAKASREAASHQRSKDTQSALEALTPDTPEDQHVSNVVSMIGAPVLSEGWNSSMVVVHTKGEDVKITGLDSLSDEGSLALFEALSALITARVEAAQTQLAA